MKMHRRSLVRGLLAAEQAIGVESAAVAALSDYCGDFSDAAVGAGTVKTATKRVSVT
jgi:hypothetical protein